MTAARDVLAALDSVLATAAIHRRRIEQALNRERLRGRGCDGWDRRAGEREGAPE
jgi:hypothetical protein